MLRIERHELKLLMPLVQIEISENQEECRCWRQIRRPGSYRVFGLCSAVLTIQRHPPIPQNSAPKKISPYIPSSYSLPSPSAHPPSLPTGTYPPMANPALGLHPPPAKWLLPPVPAAPVCTCAKSAGSSTPCSCLQRPPWRRRRRPGSTPRKRL